MELLNDRLCILFVTHQCNLNCAYCYEKFKTKTHLTFPTAKAILAEEIDTFLSQKRSGSFIVDFMGGEPLLNFELIRDISEWIWETYPQAPCKLTLRTNGTCLTPESMDWFIRNRQRIDVGLSLDGLEELQDLNRSSSSGRIPVNFFVENWPHLELKATISPLGIHLLASSAIHFYNLGIPFSLTLAHGVEWGKDAPRLLKHELLTLVAYYLQHPETQPERSLFVDDFRKLSMAPARTFHMCGARGELVAYTAEGKRSICHLFTEPTMGTTLAEEYRRMQDIPEVLPVDKACTQCPARPLCKICPGFNVLSNGKLHIQDKKICAMMQVIVQVNSIFFLKQYEARAKQGLLDEDEMQQLAWAMEHHDYMFQPSL